MGVHSEFFEFETRGEFDVVNITNRVEEARHRPSQRCARSERPLGALSKLNLNKNACETL